MKMTTRVTVLWVYMFFMTGPLAVGQETIGTLPDLRDQVLLNGVWDFTPNNGKKTTIPVPDFWGAGPGFTCDEATYERNVAVPASWKNKVIKVEFTAVQFITDVYVDGVHVGNHVGGWIPFAFDITDRVSPGKTFALKVVVKGGNHAPVADGLSRPLWPVGWFGNTTRVEGARWGIIFDVWLRAYGMCCINDAFIQTSYRKKEIRVDYELCNQGTQSRTLELAADLFNPKDNRSEKRLSGPVVTLAPGETKKVTLTSSWENPVLWTPDEPFLYYCVSTLRAGGESLDRETRRFGFREIWISGKQFKLNGVRLNLYGENINRHIQFYATDRYRYLTPSTWPATIDRLKEINIRYARFHMAPPDPRLIDIADEKGFMILGESAIYARNYVRGVNKKVYLQNCRSWISEWIRAYRNHPSIVLWSAENENGLFGLMSAPEIRSLGRAVREADPTRPVTYDGDASAAEEVVNYHYPERYENTYSGGIYRWGTKLTDRPTGIGEFLTDYGPNGTANRWWAGMLIRGLRYLGFTDVRPYTMQWAWETDRNPGMAANIKAGFAPVALFDKEYDNLGIVPIRDKRYPRLTPGRHEKRTLVLYNDEFQGTTIEVEVRLESGGTLRARGTKSITCELGEHLEIPIAFQVPYTNGAPVDLILITRKNGIEKFKETKRFAVGRSGEGESSGTVTFE